MKSRFHYMACEADGICTCLLMCAACLVSLSCNAPHSNPLDPGNPDATTSYIDGSLRTDENSPHPVGGVLVSWGNSGSITLSDQSGSFSLSILQARDGWLVFNKTGYDLDSTYIRWNNRKEIAVEKSLHITPALDSISLYTIVENNYSGPEYTLGVDVHVTATRDLDTAFIVNAELGIRLPLGKLSFGHFQGSYSTQILHLASLNGIIGHDIGILVHEEPGRYYLVGTSSVRRIINQEVATLSPKNQDTAFTNTPVLRWNLFQPGFAFSYIVQVYTDEPDPKLQWSVSSVPSDSTRMTVTPPLQVTPTSNSFFWVIWCVDEFNNMSRSKPASFICVPETSP